MKREWETLGMHLGYRYENSPVCVPDGKSGALTGYHWGITRKQAMLGWEAGQVGVH